MATKTQNPSSKQAVITKPASSRRRTPKIHGFLAGTGSRFGAKKRPAAKNKGSRVAIPLTVAPKKTMPKKFTPAPPAPVNINDEAELEQLLKEQDKWFNDNQELVEKDLKANCLKHFGRETL